MLTKEVLLSTGSKWKSSICSGSLTSCWETRYAASFWQAIMMDCLLLLLPKPGKHSAGRRSDTVQLRSKDTIHTIFVFRSGSSLLESLITSIAMVVVVQVEMPQKDMEPFNSPERPDLFIQVFLSITWPRKQALHSSLSSFFYHIFCQPVITQA